MQQADCSKQTYLQGRDEVGGLEQGQRRDRVDDGIDLGGSGGGGYERTGERPCPGGEGAQREIEDASQYLGVSEMKESSAS